MPRASRGRPLGAENKDKPYREALRMEIAAADDFKGLRAIARAHLDKARSGDMAAIKELADRLDGKPAQSHEAEITCRYVIEIPALMDNAAWEAEALEHEPDKLQAR
jgi:hypothetical protein